MLAGAVDGGAAGGMDGTAAAPWPFAGSTARPTMSLDALQATAPAARGLTARSTSTPPEFPLVAEGWLIPVTIALAASTLPGVPGQASSASLTLNTSTCSPDQQFLGDLAVLEDQADQARPAVDVLARATMALVSSVPGGIVSAAK